jgi:hypothetical protein
MSIGSNVLIFVKVASFEVFIAHRACYIPELALVAGIFVSLISQIII